MSPQKSTKSITGVGMSYGGSESLKQPKGRRLKSLQSRHIMLPKANSQKVLSRSPKNDYLDAFFFLTVSSTKI